MVCQKLLNLQRQHFCTGEYYLSSQHCLFYLYPRSLDVNRSSSATIRIVPSQLLLFLLQLEYHREMALGLDFSDHVAHFVGVQTLAKYPNLPVNKISKMDDFHVLGPVQYLGQLFTNLSQISF
jgi:hypothetical protein